MSTIASKNLYDLLGNDPELDPDREPEPPTKAVDKPVQRTGKRNAGAEGPAKDAPRPAAGGRGGRQDGLARGDQGGLNNRDDGLRADRNANRTREPREYRGEGRGEGRGRGRGRGFSDRGGRGGRGGGSRDDRHSHTGVGDHEKQAAHGWGAEQDGNAELADERAGDDIANAEAKNEGFTPDTSGADPAFSNGPDGEVNADDVAPEEDKTKSYDQYLAEQAEKRLALGGGSLEARKANEGASQKFPEGKAFSRDPEAENFMVGSGGKARKAKDTQDKKERVTIEGSYYAPVDSGDRGRGGRGRGRGRGEFRGERGRGAGSDRGRGEFRGDRGERRGRGEFRGAPRGDRGSGPRGGFNANDSSAFPALGA